MGEKELRNRAKIVKMLLKAHNDNLSKQAKDSYGLYMPYDKFSLLNYKGKQKINSDTRDARIIEILPNYKVRIKIDAIEGEKDVKIGHFFHNSSTSVFEELRNLLPYKKFYINRFIDIDKDLYEFIYLEKPKWIVDTTYLKGVYNGKYLEGWYPTETEKDLNKYIVKY
jgi:hypothetical protein